MAIHRADEVQFCKALIFGPHNAGKTRWLGTADDDERTAPMLFLDLEGGTQTLVGRDTDIVTVRDWQDYDDAYELLSDPETPYRSVGVDSISETQVQGMLTILDQPAISKGGRPGPDTFEQSDWGTILIQMRRFTRRFKALPMHVFMSALAGDAMQARVGMVKRPLLQGAFASELPGIMDVIGYMAQEDDEETGEVNRILLLRNYPKFSVKVRLPWNTEDVPDEIEDPTVTKLLDALGFGARRTKTKRGTK
jgi:hypothetical protein